MATTHFGNSISVNLRQPSPKEKLEALERMCAEAFLIWDKSESDAVKIQGQPYALVRQLVEVIMDMERRITELEKNQ